MATTEPLSGVTVYQQTDQALGGQQMGEIVNELGPLLALKYTTTGARDAAFNAWIAAGTGRSIPTGSSVFVGTRQYVYNGGWQAVAAFRGSGTAFPSDAINGDTYLHNTYGCLMGFASSAWRQMTIVQSVGSDAGRASYLSALTAAGLTLHNGFQVFQTDTDTLYVSPGNNTLQRVPSPGFLKQATGVDTTAGSTSAVMVTTSVTIPDGLPSNRRIKAIGSVFISTPVGVGGVVLAGTAATSTSRTINQAFDGDVSVLFYDSDLTPGTRAYTLWAHSTVAGQTITCRAPLLSIEII